MSNFKNVLGNTKVVIVVGAVVYLGYIAGKKVGYELVKKLDTRKQKKNQARQIEETEV